MKIWVIVRVSVNMMLLIFAIILITIGAINVTTNPQGTLIFSILAIFLVWLSTTQTLNILKHRDRGE